MGAQSLHALRTALSSAVRQGVALAAVGLTAGCAGKSERADGSGGDASGTSGSGAQGGTSGTDSGGTGSSGSAGLSPYPLEEVGCFGPTRTGGYVGQCCISARCYTPDAGACEDPVVQRAPIPLPPGSGTCLCSPTDPSQFIFKGPYAPNPDGMASPEGTCCYLVGAIGCEGRPLLVEGAAIVAPLSRRGDWCARLV